MTSFRFFICNFKKEKVLYFFESSEKKSGLSPENMFKVHMDGLLDLALDEIVERLSPEQ